MGTSVKARRKARGRGRSALQRAKAPYILPEFSDEVSEAVFAMGEEWRYDCWFASRANDYRQIGTDRPRPEAGTEDWQRREFSALWPHIKARVYKRILAVCAGRLASGSQGRRKAPKGSAARSALADYCQMPDFKAEKGKRRLARRRKRGSLADLAARQMPDDLASCAFCWLWARFYRQRRLHCLPQTASDRSAMLTKQRPICAAELALRMASAASVGKALRQTEYGQQRQRGRLMADDQIGALTEAEADLLVYRPQSDRLPIWQQTDKTDLLAALEADLLAKKKGGRKARLCALLLAAPDRYVWQTGKRRGSAKVSLLASATGLSEITIKRYLADIKQIGRRIADRLADQQEAEADLLVSFDLPPDLPADQRGCVCADDQQRVTYLWPLPDDQQRPAVYWPAEAAIALADRQRRLASLRVASAEARGQTEASRSERPEAKRQRPAEADLRPAHSCLWQVSIDDLRPAPDSDRAAAISIAIRKARQWPLPVSADLAGMATFKAPVPDPKLAMPEAALTEAEAAIFDNVSPRWQRPKLTEADRQRGNLPDRPLPVSGQTISADRPQIRSVKRRRKARRKALASSLLAMGLRRRPLPLPAYNPASDLIVTLRHWPDGQTEAREWDSADLAYRYANRVCADLIVIHG